jgi:hypothetical protein
LRRLARAWPLDALVQKIRMYCTTVRGANCAFHQFQTIPPTRLCDSSQDARPRRPGLEESSHACTT